MHIYIRIYLCIGIPIRVHNITYTRYVLIFYIEICMKVVKRHNVIFTIKNEGIYL